MTDNQLTPQDPRHQQIQIVLDSLNSPNTRRAYGRIYQDFLKWHDGQGKPPVNRAIIQRYRASLIDQGKSPASINQAMSALKKLAFEMSENGILDHNTYTSIENIPGQKYTPLLAGRHISQEEIEALLKSCQLDDSVFGVRDAAIIAMLYITGMRRSEVVNLDLANINLEESKVEIRAAKGKKDRISYLTNEVVLAIREWLIIRGEAEGALFCRIYKAGKLSYKRLTSQAIHYIVGNRERQAGLDQLTPHDLRRTIISDLLDAGEDIAVVARIVGHADVNTTARYDRRPERAMQEAIQKIKVPYKKRSRQGD